MHETAALFYVANQRSAFAAGDEVEITEGLFAGLRGFYVQTGGRNRLRISIAGLCCTTTADIGGDEVRKVNG